MDAAKTSKAQRLAKSAGELDEIVAWLDWEFAKHDNNKDGFLDYHEFVNFIRSLNLNMTTKEVGCCRGRCVAACLCRSHSSPLPSLLPPSIPQIFQFFLLADRDNDYRIVWCEIEQDVPRILSKIYEGIPEGPSDWCLMARRKEGGKKGGKEEEEVWYFNKRTSEVSKERPVEMGDGGGEDGDGGSEDGEEGGRREAVLEKTKTLDVALTWLDWEFKKADLDKNGILSHRECMAFVRGLRLGLKEKEVRRQWEGGRKGGRERAGKGGEGAGEAVNVFSYPFLLLTFGFTSPFLISKPPTGRAIHPPGRLQRRWGRGVDGGPRTHPPHSPETLHGPSPRLS
jgi:hypothetical protein